ncbi:MAG: helix-turn-helix domain-containing protein [Flavobacteriales bacterium]
MSLTNRIPQLLQQKKLSQSQFCNETGFSKQNLSKFLRGSVKHVKVEIAIVIAKSYPEVNLRWLLLGEGEMFNENVQPVNTTLHEEVIQLKDEISRLKDKIITLLEER